MAAYISVPRDLSKVKSKIFFNLTKRQLICFSIAAAVGVPLFFLVKRGGNVSLAALTMIGVMLPFFFLAMYERNGQPLEVFLRHFVTARFKRSKIRKYQTENVFRKAVRNRPVADTSRHAREKKNLKNRKSSQNTEMKVNPAENNSPSGGKEVPHVRKA